MSEHPAPAVRRDGPDPSRRVPAWATALALAVVALAGLVVALIAGRAGPLVAHPPDVDLPTLKAPSFTRSPPPALPSPPAHQLSQPSGTWLWWVAGVLGALIVLAAVLWIIRLLRRPARIAAPPVSRAGPPAQPAALALLAEDQSIDIGDDRSFDPLRAADDIIACWTALERGAAEIGCPRPSASTPTEFLGAVTERYGDADMDAAAREAADALLGAPPAGGRWTDATTLLRLYHRARFDSAALAPGAARLARTTARALLTRWHAGRHLADDTGGADDAGGDPGPADRTRPGRHR